MKKLLAAALLTLVGLSSVVWAQGLPNLEERVDRSILHTSGIVLPNPIGDEFIFYPNNRDCDGLGIRETGSGWRISIEINFFGNSSSTVTQSFASETLARDELLKLLEIGNAITVGTLSQTDTFDDFVDLLLLDEMVLVPVKTSTGNGGDISVTDLLSTVHRLYPAFCFRYFEIKDDGSDKRVDLESGLLSVREIPTADMDDYEAVFRH